MRLRALAGLAGIFLLCLGCKAEPEPILVGEDHCEQCRMQIADAHFGGEILTRKGRVVKFDSIGCLVGY